MRYECKKSRENQEALCVHPESAKHQPRHCHNIEPENDSIRFSQHLIVVLAFSDLLYKQNHSHEYKRIEIYRRKRAAKAHTRKHPQPKAGSFKSVRKICEEFFQR